MTELPAPTGSAKAQQPPAQSLTAKRPGGTGGLLLAVEGKAAGWRTPLRASIAGQEPELAAGQLRDLLAARAPRSPPFWNTPASRLSANCSAMPAPGRRLHSDHCLAGQTRRITDERRNNWRRAGQSDRMKMPAARGVLSAWLAAALRGGPAASADAMAPPVHGRRPAAWEDDDQLALWCCHKLHYRDILFGASCCLESDDGPARPPPGVLAGGQAVTAAVRRARQSAACAR